MRNGLLTLVLAAILCTLAAQALLAAQDPADGNPTPPPPSKPSGDLDNFLDMDITQLSKAEVVVSEVNPVIEGVSKKEETLSESPGIAQIITAKEIRAFGAKNLYEVLNWATSVYTTGSYLFPDNAVSIRGDLLTHNDNHTLVLINGRPMRDIVQSGLNASIYMSFPLDAIQHIEIIRGPGSVLYGTNAYSGVINIVTKKATEPSGRAAALAGSFETQKYDLTHGNGTEDAGYLVSATYGRQTGWPLTATGEDHPLQSPAATDTVNRGYDDVGIFAQAYYGAFTVNTFVSSAKQVHLGALPLWPAEDLMTDRVFVDAGYLLDHGDDIRTDFHFTYNFFTNEWSLPSTALGTSNSYLLEATHFRPITQKLDLLLGAFADNHQGQLTGGDNVPAFTETWYGVYGQLEYTPTDWLKLIGGVQGNMPGVIPGGMSPRASAIIKLTDKSGVKLLYGEAFRSPYALERSIDAPGILQGNPNLTPEAVATFDVQFYHQTQDARLAATWFHSAYRDLITRVGALPATLDNLGSMTFQGVELESTWNPSKRWHLVGSVTWQENINSDGIVDSTHVPNWQGKVGVAYDNLDGLKIGLFDILFSEPTDVTVVNPGAAIVNPPVSDLNLLSLDVRYDISRWLGCRCGRKVELECLAQNLLDEDINHPEFGRRQVNTLPAGGGVSVYGGVSVEY